MTTVTTQSRSYTVFHIALSREGRVSWRRGEVLPCHIDTPYAWMGRLGSALGRAILTSSSYAWDSGSLPAELLACNVLLINGECRWLDQEQLPDGSAEAGSFDHGGLPFQERMSFVSEASSCLASYLERCLRAKKAVDIICLVWTGEGDPCEHTDEECADSRYRF